MEFYEKTERENTIYQGKIVRLKEIDVLLSNGIRSKREVIEHPGAVAILPITNEGKIVLIQQFRKACERVLWEIPAGKLEKDEIPMVCAIRELNEETGFVARNWSFLGNYYTSPGFCNEVIHLYLATDLVSGETKFDQDEYLEVKLLSFKEVQQLIIEQEIKDLKTITALLFYNLRLQERNKRSDL